MKDFKLFLVDEVGSLGVEGTLGEGENIKMAKTVYERDDCGGGGSRQKVGGSAGSDISQEVFR